MRTYSHTICVRLSDEEKQLYERLLKRFGDPSAASKSESFRALLRKLDFSYETVWDNPGVFDSLDEQSSEESPEAPTEELMETL